MWDLPVRIPRRHLVVELADSAAWAATAFAVGPTWWLPVALLALLAAAVTYSPAVRGCGRRWLLAGLLPPAGAAALAVALGGQLAGRWAPYAGAGAVGAVLLLAAVQPSPTCASSPRADGRPGANRLKKVWAALSQVAARPHLPRGVGRCSRFRPLSGGGRMELVRDDDDRGTELGGTTALLRDTATALAARQELDGLMTALAVQPFSLAAHCRLRAYLEGSAQQGRAAYERVCAATAVPVR